MMIEFLSKGGILVGPILFCSVIALAIFFERVIRYGRLTTILSSLPEKVIGFLEQGREDLAADTATHSRSPVGRVLAGVLEVRDKDRGLAERVVAHAIDQAVRDIARYLNALAVIAQITPMLGLLGTVTGMIKSFMVIQQMGGKVNAAVLAGGIWEAMLTTALGLAVALPVMVAHNYLVSKVDYFEAQIRTSVISMAKI